MVSHETRNIAHSILSHFPRWPIGARGTVEGKMYEIRGAFLADGLTRIVAYRVRRCGTKLAERHLFSPRNLERAWIPEVRDAAE